MNQDKSARYHALSRRAAILSTGWSAAYLVLAVATPFSAWLAGWAASLAAWLSVPAPLVPTAVVAVYVAVFGLLHELGSLPLSFYRGFVLERRYGLSMQSPAAWLLDQGKAGLLGAAVSLPGFALLYLAMARWPRGWWLAAGGGFVLFVVLVARLAPVVLLPLFFRITPLSREDLRQRLVALCQRTGVPVTDACEWQLSNRTRKANAALTGLGRTRRILVSDTLLAAHGDDEIEVVLAHELGHHAHHDIWKGVAIEGAVALLGFFLASRVMLLLAPRLGWAGVADVTGLPVLALAAGCLSVALIPAANGCSRAMETAADRFALDLTRNPAAFVSAMQRLGAQNLAEERPSRVARWLFYSHPPLEDRVAAARQWEATHPAG